MNVAFWVLVLSAVGQVIALVIPFLQNGDFSWGAIFQLLVAVVTAVIAIVVNKAARIEKNLKARGLI